MTICGIDDHRIAALHEWLRTIFSETLFSIDPIAGDASFRRYFRIQQGDNSFIAMDAPPSQESCDAFVVIAQAFSHSVVRMPHIFAQNIIQGFLLLSDFGDQQLLPLLNNQTSDAYYTAAMDVLQHMQQTACAPPHFDAALFWREFAIFDHWYIQKHCQKNLSPDEKQALKQCYQLLIDAALQQPQVFVHRDYHSRNIMVCADNGLGILDFQDAVIGPITYDLVSLLRDCYIAWPDEKIAHWVKYFYQRLKNNDNMQSMTFATFMRFFDWMGLQRHLKCLGIFARLYYRDGKSSYLKEIPRVLHYAIAVCEKYPELSLLKTILRSDTLCTP